MTREFKVGDKVFDVGTGNGVVKSISKPLLLSVFVNFENGESSTYTRDGRYFNSDLYPTLFHGHDLIIEVKEPEYEWQILSKLHDKPFELSAKFYKSLDPYIYSACSYEALELFEPSKRLVKRG